MCDVKVGSQPEKVGDAALTELLSCPVHHLPTERVCKWLTLPLCASLSLFELALCRLINLQLAEPVIYEKQTLLMPESLLRPSLFIFDFWNIKLHLQSGTDLGYYRWTQTDLRLFLEKLSETVQEQSNSSEWWKPALCFLDNLLKAWSAEQSNTKAFYGEVTELYCMKHPDFLSLSLSLSSLSSLYALSLLFTMLFFSASLSSSVSRSLSHMTGCRVRVEQIWLWNSAKPSDQRSDNLQDVSENTLSDQSFIACGISVFLSAAAHESDCFHTVLIPGSFLQPCYSQSVPWRNAEVSCFKEQLWVWDVE